MTARPNPTRTQALLTIVLLGLALTLTWQGRNHPAAAAMFAELIPVLEHLVRWYFPRPSITSDDTA